MLLAAAGHDVLLVDRDTFPSDTLSTHAIARSGVVQLNRWGLLPDVLATGAPPLREVVFRNGDTSITRTVKERLGVDMLIAPRRHILDSLLIDAAVSAGAQVVTGVTVDGVRRSHTGRVSGVEARTTAGPVMYPPVSWWVPMDEVRGIARSVGAGFTEVRGEDERHSLRILFRRLAGDGVPHRRSFVLGCLPDERRRGLYLGMHSGRHRTSRPTFACHD